MPRLKTKRLYFDYAASTPVDPRVEEAMRPYFGLKFGNPGSLHSFGQEAIAALDRSREIIASAVGVGFREIIFTGSATEANNLALRGVVGGAFSSWEKTSLRKSRVIVSVIEHESVLETVCDLEREGLDVVYLPVSREGVVDLKKLEKSLNSRTALVSIMYANNELGTVQPIREIAGIIKEFRAKNATPYPLFHTDAVQAFQFLDCNLENLGVDLMTLSAHKIYGPKGIGVLCARSPLGLKPVIAGGGQEFGLRSGTENVPLAVGFSRAVELAVHSRDAERKKLYGFTRLLWDGIKAIVPRAEMNGVSMESDSRLPNILNVYFPGWEAQDIMTRFDLFGLAVSGGSACSSRSSKPSHVLSALGLGNERARQSIRFSLGRPTKKNHIGTALRIVKNIFHHGKN